ncbi:MAG: hypothetical protein KAR06_12435 [Deltaproteobacteria bacterium]|nr:hypothetical protein [Deltaproteobacteria bacterium]
MKLIRCHSCGKDIADDGIKYIIEIKSFADYEGYLEDFPGDITEGINEILDAVEEVDPKTLEDEVYQEDVYLLCKTCRDKFSDDPFRTGYIPTEGESAKGTVH